MHGCLLLIVGIFGPLVSLYLCLELLMAHELLCMEIWVQVQMQMLLRYGSQFSSPWSG